MRSGIDSIRDPLYEKLMETKEIEEIATAKFKTFGSSRLWIMDYEISSFIDLILHDITEEDILRSHAWLVDSKKFIHA